jgi:hypothetical protein
MVSHFSRKPRSSVTHTARWPRYFFSALMNPVTVVATLIIQ